MILISLLFLGILAQQQGGAAVQTGPINQTTKSKDCTFNIAGVTGNVHAENCPGIPAKALEGLNKELTARRLSEQEAREQTEIWRKKYEDLQKTLATAGLSQGLINKASACLNKCDLVCGANAFDLALRQQQQEINVIASTHFYRAK